MKDWDGPVEPRYIKMPEELHNAIKSIAARRGISLPAAYQEALGQWLDQPARRTEVVPEVPLPAKDPSDTTPIPFTGVGGTGSINQRAPAEPGTYHKMLDYLMKSPAWEALRANFEFFYKACTALAAHGQSINDAADDRRREEDTWSRVKKGMERPPRKKRGSRGDADGS